VVALTKSIARFAGPHGVVANTVSPGVIETPMIASWPPEVKERLLGIGTEVVGSSPEQLAARMKSELARLPKLIKDAGIKVE